MLALAVPPAITPDQLEDRVLVEPLKLSVISTFAACNSSFKYRTREVQCNLKVHLLRKQQICPIYHIVLYN